MIKPNCPNCRGPMRRTASLCGYCREAKKKNNMHKFKNPGYVAAIWCPMEPDWDYIDSVLQLGHDIKHEW